MTQAVIGFTGYAGAGKSTAALHMSRQLMKIGFTVAIVSMATPLKRMVEVLFDEADIGRDVVHNRSAREVPIDAMCGRSPRHIMQTLGTEWGRQCVGDDVWCRVARSKILAMSEDVVLIDDIRFDNEVEMVKSFDAGHIIRIERPDVGPVNNHASENPPGGHALVIPNAADVLHLDTMVAIALQRIGVVQ